MKKKSKYFNELFYLIRNISRETLKKKVNGIREWSRTSLTMFSAWILVVFMVIFDLYKEGFRYDVFVTMCGVALGTKVTDAYSKKLNKNESTIN